MEQKERNKIAWILTGVLAPLLIYLLVTNIAKVRKTMSPPTPPALGVSPSPGAGFVPPGAEVQPPPPAAPAVDPKISAEQKRIAALLPEINPFNPSRPVSVEPAPAAAVPKTTAPPPAAAPPAPTIKLAAILSRGGGRIAMINGRFLGEGDRVANWTIIKVNSRDVLLKDGDRQMTLRLK